MQQILMMCERRKKFSVVLSRDQLLNKQNASSEADSSTNMANPCENSQTVANLRAMDRNR